MEEQLAELAKTVAEQAKLIAALTTKSNVTNTMFAETYYYLTIPLMIIIHAGFLAYEMGASRVKNVLASGIKNILAFAFIVPTFYFFGWWIYWGFPTGIPGAPGPNGISGIEYANAVAAPWVEAMGPNISDNANGVFWGAFTLFAATTASIMSGALIERIQVVGFVILAIVLGSFAWGRRCCLGLACRWLAGAGLGCSRLWRCRSGSRRCRLLCPGCSDQSRATDRQVQR